MLITLVVCIQESWNIFNRVEQLIISKEINKLLELEVIRVTQRQNAQVISPIFLRRKNSGYRIVINLEKLSDHIPYIHFKMENFEQAIRLINAGDSRRWPARRRRPTGDRTRSDASGRPASARCPGSARAWPSGPRSARRRTSPRPPPSP